jgi:hypothetical protein
MTKNSKDDDAKAKFLEALEKKKRGQGLQNSQNSNSAKVSGSQAAGNTPKMFRRKSGSA